ncbi:MAG: hypothetical protein AB7N76_17045 [Planctomycetota bacterium]
MPGPRVPRARALGLGAAALALLLPLWLLPVLRALSAPVAVRVALSAGGERDPWGEPWPIDGTRAALDPDGQWVSPAPPGQLSRSLTVAWRYHLGLAALLLWAALPLAPAAPFDARAPRAWGRYILLAAYPATFLAFCGYRLGEASGDLVRQASPLLVARPRVAGALLGVGAGLLWAALRTALAARAARAEEGGGAEVGTPGV